MGTNSLDEMRAQGLISDPFFEKRATKSNRSRVRESGCRKLSALKGEPEMQDLARG